MNILLVIHLILTFLLILVVLLQSSEGGGLGIGGSGNNFRTGRAAVTGLAKLTWILAVLFIITSVALTVLSTTGGDSSVLDSQGVQDTQQEILLPPGFGQGEEDGEATPSIFAPPTPNNDDQ